MSNRVQSNKKDFKGQNIFVGIDVHLRQWTVTVLTESDFMKKFSQPSGAQSLFDHLRKNYHGGTYHAVYESGFCGYSACYALRELGIDCQIVHAADVPTTQKEKVTKSDPVDSEKLARSLRNGDLTKHPLGRTRIFPWQPPQTLHDSINIGLYLYVWQNCCTFAPSYTEV